MAISVKDRQQKLRNRMYEAGYKNLQIWVKRTDNNKFIDEKTFNEKLDKVISKLDDRKKSVLYNKLLSVASAQRRLNI